MKLKYLPLIIIFIGLKVSAQSVKFDKKSLSFLKSAKEIQVEFIYDSLKFDSNKITEGAYLDKRIIRLDKDENKDSEAWIKAYHNSKKNDWQEAFVNMLNKKLKLSKKDIEFKLDAKNPEYKLIVNTTWMYLGYDIGVISEPAKLKLDFAFIDYNDPKKILSKLFIKRASGNNKNIDNDSQFPHLKRVARSYEKSAFMLYLVLKRFSN